VSGDSCGLEERTAALYTTKETRFAFRGRTFAFALSQGLFSAASIDRGSSLLLKTLSKILDEDRARGAPAPETVLDSGCGIGVLGICAAAALDSSRVRCQDRDQLAAVFTRHNARKNNIPPDRLSAHTEMLLASPPEARWDLILSNIPAKAGKPVLEDFVIRSASLLTPQGRALIVAVNPLAAHFRLWIAKAGAPLLREEQGPGHTVFMYGHNPLGNNALHERGGLWDIPAYRRAAGVYQLEGVSYELDSVYGVRDFDQPGGAVRAGAKLIARWGARLLPLSGAVLIHEPAQGHFPAWLIKYLAMLGAPLPQKVVLSGRNILALEISRRNIAKNSQNALEIDTVPLVDLALAWEQAALPEGCRLIAAFPEPVPQAARPFWEGMAPLLAEGGAGILCLPAWEAARSDREKHPSLARLFEAAQKGFRAFARRKSNPR
jgi:16S rRNA G1207 methylase RsmC